MTAVATAASGGQDAVRVRQARQALRWLQRHPWATSTEIARACDLIRTPGMWEAVRPYAYDEAPRLLDGAALTNSRAGGRSAWALTSEADYHLVHLLERMRHYTTRTISTAAWNGTDLLAEGSNLAARALARMAREAGIRAEGHRDVIAAMDEWVATERRTWHGRITSQRSTWTDEPLGQVR